MKIVYAANNKNGLIVLKELIKQKIEIEYLILHPFKKAKFFYEILSQANIKNENIIVWNKKNIFKIKEKLMNKTSNILFSVNFGYKIPNDILELFELPINLHISYLPFNKGANPNIWPIIDGSPAGVTLHKMTSNFDEGQILFQEKVAVNSLDTGKTLYQKLEKKSVEIVKKYFNKIVKRDFILKNNNVGTYHTKDDFKAICKIDLKKEYKAKDLINLLRGLTYPPYKNAYFIDENGEKIYIDIKLYKENKNDNSI